MHLPMMVPSYSWFLSLLSITTLSSFSVAEISDVAAAAAAADVTPSKSASSSSSSSAAAADSKTTHVLPLIPHHVQRRRVLEENARHHRNLLDADQIAALYHGYGTHYIDFWCGSPPQRQTVIVDTGSGVTAFPCSACHDCGAPDYHIDNYFIEADSSSFKAVECGECKRGTCRTDQCSISMSYQEGSSWHAYEAVDNCYVGGPHIQGLLKDDGGTDDLDPMHAAAFAAPITFGCQTRLTGLFKTQLADGIMGMENNKMSYWKQLYDGGKIDKQQFALCYSRPVETDREGTVAGAMTLGGVDPRLDDTPLVYTSGATGGGGFYNVKVRAMYLRPGEGGESAAYSSNVDTVSLSVPSGSFIVDSGTTDTYVNRQISHSFREAFKKMTGNEYNHKGMTLSDDDLAKLPTILFQLEGDIGANGQLPEGTVGLAGELDKDHPTDVILAVPPSHYMEVDNHGKYTARFYDDESGGSVIGANAMMGHNIHFDIDTGRIGWAESSCDYSELLAANGYTSIFEEGGEVEKVAEQIEDQEQQQEDEESGKKSKPNGGSDHDKETPPDDMMQSLSNLADSCDSFACRGGAVGILLLLLTCCVCLMRCCCCPSRKSAVPPLYQRAEVEMNGISTSYRDEDGFKDEPDHDDGEEYGEFNP